MSVLGTTNDIPCIACSCELSVKTDAFLQRASPHNSHSVGHVSGNLSYSTHMYTPLASAHTQPLPRHCLAVTQ